VNAPIRLRTTDLEWRDVEDGIVAVDLEASVYLAVNRAGSLLWPMLAEGAHRGELVARLALEFGLDEEAAGRDVDAFLSTLGRQGLLEGGEPKR
jgi:hypothetical protein